VLESGQDYVEVEMRNRFRKGDTLECLTPTKNFNAPLVIGDMWDERGNLIDDAKIVQQKVRIATDLELRAGDILRRKR
jgi:hypothetical protein